MIRLETRLPPPLVMLLLGLAASVAALRLPAFGFPVPWITPVAVALIGAGVVLNVWPKFAFRRAGTTVNPLAPASTTRLVTSGIYRYTRNPMYLGHAVILLGWTLALQHAVVLVAVPVFVAYVTRFQIRAEERVLAARFPDDYAAFRARTRRWL